MDIAQVYPRGTRPGVYADVFTLVDINDAGFTVGSYYRYGLYGTSAILIEPPYGDVQSKADVIFLPSAFGGYATAINENNLIVGTSASDSTSGTYAAAYVYDGVVVEYLDPLPGGLHSGAADIDDFDRVVGYSESSSGNRAVMWDGATGSIQDLNEFLVAGSCWVLSSAVAINNAGDIVGLGLLNGQPHGFLLSSDTQPPPTNLPPVAIASVDNPTPLVRTKLNFFSAGSHDPDGQIVAFSWDFGDGRNSLKANPIHRYKKPGTYLTVLTVTDDRGKTTNSSALEIIVNRTGG